MIKEDVLKLVDLVPTDPDTPLPHGANPGDVNEFELSLGKSIPQDYKEWLRYYNGPLIGPGGIYGIGTATAFLDLTVIVEYYPRLLRNDFLPVAGDGTGNLYVADLIVCRNGVHPIYFYDHEDEEMYIVASGFWVFLYFLLHAEMGDRRWPFDQTHVLLVDPEISNCKARAAFPWQ